MVFYHREKDGKEVKLISHSDSYNFGKIYVDCNLLSCTVYRSCQDYNQEEFIDIVCEEKLLIEDIGASNINKMSLKNDLLIIATKGETTSLFVYDLVNQTSFSALVGLLPD